MMHRPSNLKASRAVYNLIVGCVFWRAPSAPHWGLFVCLFVHATLVSNK